MTFPRLEQAREKNPLFKSMSHVGASVEEKTT